MTVQSEVAFGPENLALPQPEIAARVDWASRSPAMAAMRQSAVLTLSGGQKQRTAIAATLAMRPRVLVLDEPLSDLDPVGAQEVLGTLRRLARDHGTGVVVIEHRVDEVVPWADRIVLMDDGRIVMDRPPRGAWDDPAPWTGRRGRHPRRRPAGQGAAAGVPRRRPAVGGRGGRRAAGRLVRRRAGRRSRLVTGAARRRRASRTAAARPPSTSRPDRGQPVLSWQQVSVEFGGTEPSTTSASISTTTSGSR